MGCNSSAETVVANKFATANKEEIHQCQIKCSSSSRQVLPTNVKPLRYEVGLTPNFTEPFKYKGFVKVSLIVNETSQKIICNVKELEIISVHIIKNSKEKEAAKNFTVNQELQQLETEFENSLIKDENLTFVVEFFGFHNDKFGGFYRSSVEDEESEFKWLMVTQFQSTDCRRAFPCWDEPSLKAQFDITLRIPKTLTALSNESIENEVIENDLKVVKFNTTPKMSTYLVAFAVGQLEYLSETIDVCKALKNCTSICNEVKSKLVPVTVKVWTGIGEKQKGKFALDIAIYCLKMFTEIFKVPYPLSKMDILCVDDFTAGAMENWGLITFTPEFILCDEYSTLQTKMDVAETVAHEIAHQWFGNLVTMNWWDDLWLNEGFATFISMIAMDLRFPDWSYFNTYITEDYDDGLERDSMHTSHPIQAAVKIPSEINDIFDDITYSKASGVIRMLYYFVGKETFNIGVSSYLKSFSYQNAVSEDLWDHLGKSSGINISSLMKTWITQVGYPLLRVLEEKYNEKNQEMTITLRQERFLTSQNFNVTDSNSLWSIPLGLKTNEKDYNFLMCKKEETFTFKYKKDKNSYWKMNNQLYGFFRVLLNPEESIKLCRMNDLPPSEKIGLISDSFALARAGLTSIADSLELLNEFLSEDDVYILKTIASILQNLISIIYKEDTKVLHSLKKFQKKIFYRHLKIVGWEYIENEDHFTQLKRTVVILSLADVGEESVIMEFDARMKKYMNGELGALNSNLVQKGLDLHLQSSKNQLEEIKRLLHLYATSPNDDVKVQSLQSLGCTSSPEAIDYLLKDALLNLNVIKSYDVRTVLYNLTYNSPIPLIVKPLLWKWFKKNWDVLVDRYYTTKGSLKAILVICTSTSVDKEFISEIKSWAAGEDCTEEIVKQKRLLILKSLKSKLEYSLEEIENNARFIEISKSELLKWAELNK